MNIKAYIYWCLVGLLSAILFKHGSFGITSYIGGFGLAYGFIKAGNVLNE